ncbi:MAG TPA: MmcQ/YjbR family DNA-binding protein, partial [Candidatus Acidoferrales bacterium]|nr:MmcQ/YjbR family DNA-binding protein [Candidatus Acidoferrales bacterium]
KFMTTRRTSKPPRKKKAKQGRKAVNTPAAFDAVRKIALALDYVEEGTSYGTAAFKVGGELFVRMHQDGESLVVRTDFEQREELMASDPETYYITDHYLNYEWILIRLSRVHPDALRDLIRMAWRLASTSKRRSSRS